MTTQTRVPAGVTTGGQFSTSSRAEADVALADDPYQGHAATIGDRLAAAVGADAVTELDVEKVNSCGVPPDARFVSMQVDVPGSPIGEQVRLGALLFPDGATREVAMTSAWRDPEGEGIDAISLPHDARRDHTDLGTHVEDVRLIGRHQRALDASLNRPQREHARKYRPIGRNEILNAVAGRDSQGRTVVTFEDGHGGREALRVRLDECRRVEALAIETMYGRVSVGDGDRDKVAGRLDRDLAFALGEELGTDPNAWGVSSLSARMAGALPQDD